MNNKFEYCFHKFVYSIYLFSLNKRPLLLITIAKITIILVQSFTEISLDF